MHDRLYYREKQRKERDDCFGSLWQGFLSNSKIEERARGTWKLWSKKEGCDDD